MEINVVALHGLLGEGADWDATRDELQRLRPEPFRWIAPDYAKLPALAPATTELGEWGENFREWLRTQNIAGPKILVGYSQGGRLALHSLADGDFDRYVIVSAQADFPGDETVRAQRRQNDERWAQRFLSEDPQQVLKEWNEQPIFGGREAPARRMDEASRKAAADSLRVWSVSRQRDHSPLVLENQARVTWVVGGDDAKYLAAAEALRARGLKNIRIIKDCGHRVPSEAPAKLAAILNEIKF